MPEINKEPSIEIVEEISYIEIVEENTTIEIVEEIVDIIEIGVQGPPGLGMPSGGNTNEVLSKKSNENYDYEWIENPYDTIIQRYDADDDGKVDSAEFADLAANSNYVDGKDINDYYNKDETDLITRKYTYNQSSPSTYWTLNHNLNRYPNIIITDTTGSVIEGSVIYSDLNTAIVSFNLPISGKASVS